MQHNNKHRRYCKEEQYNTYDKITQYRYRILKDKHKSFWGFKYRYIMKNITYDNIVLVYIRYLDSQRDESSE
jgi:hypothetical protein